MLSIGFVFILALALPLPSHVSADLCSYVLTKDCAFVADRTEVCGTDGKTYRNSLLVSTIPGLVKGDICAYVLTRDCAFLANFTNVCGTDGITYRNDCFLAKAYCSDNTIHKKSDGPCPMPVTTPSPVDGGQVALDIFCLDLIYIKCPTGGAQICGSDGTFYDNICEFDKQRCFHRDLQDNGTNCS